MTQQFGEHPEWYVGLGPGHNGIDFGVNIGTEVRAAADGSVYILLHNPDPGCPDLGNCVGVEHQDGYKTLYAHLSQINAVKGQAVKAGDVVGLSGNTGRSTGPHLHFALKKVGATNTGQTPYLYDFIDPNPFLGAYTPPPAITPPAQASMQVQVYSPDTGFLRVRTRANGDEIAQVQHGAKLDALEAVDIVRRKLGQTDNWLWVRTPDGKVGYVAAWYVQAPGATPKAAEPFQVIAASGEVPLKVRGGPDVNQAILAQVPDGTALTVVESDEVARGKVGQLNQWLNVKTDQGITGYSAAWYVRLPPSSDVAFGLGDEEPMQLFVPNDLTLIKGIGPKTARLLNIAGVIRFEQLAAMTPDEIKVILDDAEIAGQYLSTWPEQARELSAAH
jgi:hypothetical protein